MYEKDAFKGIEEEEVKEDFEEVDLTAGLVIKANIRTINYIFKLVNKNGGKVVYKKIVSPDVRLVVCTEAEFNGKG